MALVHGQPIDAQQLEIETAAWDARRFAGLCNGLAWALTWSAGPASIPAFTERVDVADNGVDAEWSRRFSAAGHPRNRLIRPGLNVFQYKKRTGGPANRGKVIAKLTKELRTAAASVEKRLGRRISSYVLWVNVDIATRQKDTLRAEILKGLKNTRKRRLHVEIVGTAELAAMLNDVPHLRSAFLVRAAFRGWGAAFEAHRAQSIQSGEGSGLATLVGRDELLGTLCKLVDDAAVRAIVLTGPHMMGKTRLALEATVHRDVDFVECMDPGVTADALQRLRKDGREIVVLLPDPDLETANRVLRESLALQGAVKLLVTLPTQEGTLAPNFGLDDRVRIVPLQPLEETAAHSLLTGALGKQRLDYGLESWILDQAGGVPGIILAAASLGTKLRPEAGRFAEQVGGALEARLHRDLPSADVIRSMEAASVLTHVRVDGKGSAELRALCKFVGISPSAFLSAVQPLEQAGFIGRRGSYVEALPPILANRMAASVIRGRAQEAIALFDDLPEGARKRLLLRLAQVGREDADPFWSLLFAPGGRLGSFDAVFAQLGVYRAAAPAGVPRAVAVVHDALAAMSVDERRAIQDDARQQLVWAMQEMLGVVATAERAFRVLALLAEGEDDKIRGHARDVLCDAAHPLHPQVPLALERRMAVLREMLDPSGAEAAALVALDVAESAVRGPAVSVLRRSRGALPAGGLPSGLTWSDVFAYRRWLLDAIASAAQDPRSAVRRRAKAAWPDAAQNLVYDGGENAAAAIAAFGTIVDRILAGDDELPVAETVDALAYSRLNVVDPRVAGRPAEADDLAPQLLALVRRLKGGSYAVRVKWHVGNVWRGIDDDEEEDAAARRNPFQAKRKAIEELAKEACDDPAKLTDDLIAWCLSPAASAMALFWEGIGKNDGRDHWTATALATARADDWRSAFAYVRGAAQRDRAKADALFDIMRHDPEANPVAVAHASAATQGADSAAVLATEFVKDGRLAPDLAADFADQLSFEEASADPLLDLLEAVGEPRLERADLVVRVLSHWFQGREPASRQRAAELGWRCLEAGVDTRGSNNIRYLADALAAQLVKLDPARGFRLLDAALVRAMQSPSSADWYRTWSPLDRIGIRHLCWDELREVDRDRALTAVFDAIVASGNDGPALIMSVGHLARMPEDLAFLRRYAAKGEAQALAVAGVISSRDEGFWPLACEIYERFPDSKAIGSRLSVAIEQLGLAVSGSYAAHQNSIVQQIELARDTLAGPRTRMWLDGLAGRLRAAASENRRREEDRWIDD